MVAPLLIGSAALSIVEGILGYGAAQKEKASAALAGKIQAKAADYELQAAIDAGKLQLQAAGLDSKAAIMNADGIAAATGAAVFDALLSGEADAKTFDAQADAAEFNSKVAGQLARAAKAKGKTDASDFRREQGARLASNKAVQAASGFTLEGSPLLVDRSIFAEIEIGAARLQHAGDVDFFKYLSEEELQRREATNVRMSAALSRKAGEINASYARQAGEISRKAALMGLDSAELERQGAVIGMNAARKKTSITKQSIKVGVQAQTDAATYKGYSSLIGGANAAVSSLSTQVKFG